ncbi:hypothetical protein Nepgr_020795 [Nepenthes gracilis]|uniref:Secreted protein n=1 Tax=Nepenthes gracilis TaxID=150966 RepID=A0AAD3SXK3_NEPGR|nr:hypothetical protein Nepgr_020795 [Nepenthes gracilis]
MRFLLQLTVITTTTTTTVVTAATTLCPISAHMFVMELSSAFAVSYRETNTPRTSLAQRIDVVLQRNTNDRIRMILNTKTTFIWAGKVMNGEGNMNSFFSTPPPFLEFWFCLIGDMIEQKNYIGKDG